MYKKNIIYGQLFECQNYNTRLIQNIFIHTIIFINNNNHLSYKYIRMYVVTHCHKRNFTPVSTMSIV